MVLSESPISIASLNNDCLYEIFSHLQLEDLINLRCQCSRLNNFVCEYLPRVTLLSIVLSKVHASWEDKEWPHEDAVRRILKDCFGDERYFSLHTYGRHSFTFLEDNTMGESQKHFRLENFIVIRNRQKFRKFKEFIQKYKVRKIEKLAVIIDHRKYLSDLAELLSLWTEVKVLFLDRTHQSVGRNFQRTSIEGWDLRDLFTSITNLSSLIELHFFARKCSAFNTWNLLQPGIRLKVEEQLRAFISTMFEKLEIFYINHDSGDSYGTPVLRYSLSQLNYENIQELGIPLSNCLPWGSSTKFSNLRSLTLLGYSSSSFENQNLFERLETLKFYTPYILTKQTTEFLNSLLSLKNLFVERFSLLSDFGPVIKDQYVNKTIEHITIELQCEQVKKFSNDKIREYAYTEFFQNLSTITITRPEVTVYQKKDSNHLRLFY